MVALGQRVKSVLIPATYGRAVFLRQGQLLRVTDVQGQQVCDFFAFHPSDPTEFLSPSISRVALGHMRPRVGKPLYNNTRQPILLLEEDTVGVHDMCLAACDPARYGMYGVWQHRSCKMNVLEALEELNIYPAVFPDSVNIFQNSPLDRNARLTIYPAASKAGDCVVFRALKDLVVAGSACPMDLNPVNGYNPTDILFEVYEAVPGAIPPLASGEVPKSAASLQHSGRTPRRRRASG